jgi:uncharacterized membrane protein
MASHVAPSTTGTAAATVAAPMSDESIEQLLAQHLNPQVLERLQEVIHTSEQSHTGQIVLCIEEHFSPEDAERYNTPHARALALFGELRVWDTEHNNGAMLYLLLDRHAIELIADRALYRCVEPSVWSGITAQLAAALRTNAYENGLQTALRSISDVLCSHFPACPQTPRDNTVADAPVLLR